MLTNHTHTPTRKQPHIAIIGAGITGTTLAIALTRRGIPFTVYEQSPSPTELGAGLGFGPNAARAMKIVDERLWEVFLRVSTPRDVRSSSTATATASHGEGGGVNGGVDGSGEVNGHIAVEGGEKGEGEEPVWIEFLDGTSHVDAKEIQPAFKVHARFGKGHGAVHRAKWLEVLMGMVPEGLVQFGKRLEEIDQTGERVVLRFEDGTTAEADAVIGCDGVKSKVREVMVGGREKYGARCGYSGKYAYRCMIPMERAVEELGRARTGLSSLWVGSSRSISRGGHGHGLTRTDGPRETRPHLSGWHSWARSATQSRSLCNGLERVMAQARLQKLHATCHKGRRPARL
jgi:salicylate hydroxylase